jgi:hypothetical protein
VIAQLNSEIAMSMMTDFLLVGHEQVGARSMRENAQDTFAHAASGFLDSICDVINRFAIPELVELNGWSMDLSPKLAHGPVAEISLADLVNFIEKMVGAGLILPYEKLEEHLLQRAQLPPAPPREERLPVPPTEEEMLNGEPAVPGAKPNPFQPGAAADADADADADAKGADRRPRGGSVRPPQAGAKRPAEANA